MATLTNRRANQTGIDWRLMLWRFLNSVLGYKARSWRYENLFCRSDYWHRVRTHAMARSGGWCARCGGRATQVHHLTYANIGHEHNADLVTLCRACHAKSHGK